MKRNRALLVVLFGLWLLTATSFGQQGSAVVPHLVSFSGNAIATRSSNAGVTFAIYKQQSGSPPLWLETQTVTVDAKGNYTAQLGLTTAEGLPSDLFSSGEARWLGVRINGGEEQPRILLMSVPYALKAEDAATLGGLPPSAFMLAAPVTTGGNVTATPNASSAGSLTPASTNVTTIGGTVNTLPLFSAASSIQNSALAQTGTGATAKIGIGTTAPAAVLDVKGTETVRGVLTLPAKNPATTAKGFSSQPLSMVASTYSSTTAAPVNEYFNWQAEAAGNNSTKPSATMNLLFGAAGSLPAETGLKIAANGQISFAPGQVFPGGGGTISSIGFTAPTSDFTVTNSPLTSNGTLGLGWTVAPTNSATASAIVKRDASGNFSANVIKAGGLQVVAPSEGIGSTSSANLSNTAAISGRATATGDGTTHGINGFSSTNQGAGVFGENTVSGHGVLGVAVGSSGQGVWGESSGTAFDSAGQGSDGVHGQAHSTAGSGVAGLNDDPAGVGVYGQGTGYYSAGSGYGVYAVGNTGVYGGSVAGAGVFGTSSIGFGFATDTNVQQARAAGGWVKAMALVSASNNGGLGNIYRCFNSTLTGAVATTPPCGFVLNKNAAGDFIVDFGFEVDDRFISATPTLSLTISACTTLQSGGTCDNASTPTQAEFVVRNAGGQFVDSNFSIVVF